ncbi:uncharacterized protein LOC144123179 [Amblyomma americanum]
MKGAVVNICIFSLVFLASSAYKLPEDDFKLAGLVAAESMSSAEEAILVGHILREAARDIEKSHAEADEVEEYSWRSFWLKVKQALITAAKKIKAFFTKVGKELYESLKEVAKSAAEAALEAAKNKALEKAIQIADKIIEKSVARYSLPGSENDSDFVRHFCERMDLIGKHLIDEGERRLSQ